MVLENLNLGRLLITAHGSNEQGEFVLISNGSGNFQLAYYNVTYHNDDYSQYRWTEEITEEEFCSMLSFVKEVSIQY